MYACEYCGELHRFPISAALCCDAVSNTVEVEPDHAA